MSSNRSRITVAKAPVAVIRSSSRFVWRARKYGRMTSPARAGRMLLAANPTAVARNAFAKLARPSGSSRNCQRNARITRLRIAVNRNAEPADARVHNCGADVAQRDVAQEQDDEHGS